MTHKISRRDFLSGTALMIAGGLTPLAQLRAQATPYYPPALTGLRGSHPGSFEVAHQVGREGKTFDIATLPVEETVDLIVVGGGISGLAAAWFYREAHGPQARILILDNHDDFGGHAKRNEFRVDDRLLLGYGGTESLQSPKTLFSKNVRHLLRSLGVQTQRFDTAFDRSLYGSFGLTEGVFFDREHFGVDALVRGSPVVTGGDTDRSDAKPPPAATVIAQFPLSEDARSRLTSMFDQPRDYLAGKSTAEKIAYLKGISYRDYLRRDAGLGEEAVKYFDGSTIDLLAMGTDITPAFEALVNGYPGFAGLGLDDQRDPAFAEPYIYHFPDGNASIARLLVRSLIPGVASGHTMDDVVLADFDYSMLDRSARGKEDRIRLRLNSTAVHVANRGGANRGAADGGGANRPGGEGMVDVGYIRAGTLHRVAARHCVLACYNMIIPHIMPELPPAQQQALALGVKLPLVYVNVAIRNWHAFEKLGIDRIYCPNAFFSNVKLDFPVTLGGYRNPRDPSEPILLHMVHVPLTPNQGLTNVQQFRAGRARLLATPFEVYEQEINAQLDRMLGDGGFQSSRDIAAITVNRWPHGYAYDPNTLFDPDTPGPPPNVIGRQRCGQVTIANSDAGWSAYTHEAIDQAWRAVNELCPPDASRRLSGDHVT
jgi:spermidine dehydrogenase